MKILYYVQYANYPKTPSKICAKSQQKKLDKLEQVCYNIIKIRGADKPTEQSKGIKVMRTKLTTVKEITRAIFSDITIFDIQSATIYDSAMEFFQYNKNAKECFAMLAAHDYTVAEILSYSKEIQEKSRYRLMIDTLDRLIEDGFIICYTGLEVLD